MLIKQRTQWRMGRLGFRLTSNNSSRCNVRNKITGRCLPDAVAEEYATRAYFFPSQSINPMKRGEMRGIIHRLFTRGNVSLPSGQSSDKRSSAWPAPAGYLHNSSRAPDLQRHPF